VKDGERLRRDRGKGTDEIVKEGGGRDRWQHLHEHHYIYKKTFA
jgi:hypothetical protein